MSNQTFFGKEIRRDIRDTQVTQIYKILVSEIASGRWKIDARFPSVTQLVGDTGLSRGSIQKVLARLESDGLIATEARRGTFVIGLKPAASPAQKEPELEFADALSVETAGSASRTAPPTRAPIPAPEDIEMSKPGDRNPQGPSRIRVGSAPDSPGSRRPVYTSFQWSFRRSICPPVISSSSEARVGIALIRSDSRIQSAPHHGGDLLPEALIDQLHEFGYKSSVGFVDPSPDWEILSDGGEPFDDPVDGIIALSSSGFVDFAEPPDGCCPVVFVSGAESRALPCVTRDFSLGAYRATRDLIADGHTQIVACPESGFETAEGDAFLNGHRDAMRRVGLLVDEDSIALARGLQNGDFASLRQFLHQIRDATAILCGNPRRATDIIALCDALGIHVPTDLSVVTIGLTPMRGDLSGESVTGFEFPAEKLAHAALLLLDEVLHTGTTRFSQVRIPPVKIQGNSSAPPRRRNV